MNNTTESLEAFLQNLVKLYFNHDYRSICNILRIEHNLSHNDDIINKYSKSESGMIFHNDNNPSTNVRISVDEETRCILNTLIMVTSNSINERQLIDLMIEKWLKKVHIVGLLSKNDMPKTIGNEHRIHIKLGKIWWNNLIKTCKNKNILVKEGFKLSILNYITEVSSNNKEYNETLSK